MSVEKFTSILEEVDKSVLKGQGDSRDQLTLLRMILESSEKYNHPLKILEKQWQGVESVRAEMPGGEGYRQAKSDDQNTPWVEIERHDYSQSAMVSFVSFINLNLIPPPEVLLAISSMFSNYLENDGQATLGEAFFGSDLNKDSLAKSEFDKAIAKKFDIEIFKNSRSENPLSQEELAASLVGKGKGFNIEPKNIIQKWRRYYQEK